MKSTLRTPPRCNIHAKKVFIHTLINSESSPRCLEDILISRAGRDMELSYFSPLSQLHTTKDLDSALIQQPPKLQQILKFVLVSRHLFFTSQCCWGRKKKRSWKEMAFLVPTIWTRHCPNTCSLHPSMDSWFLLASHQHRLSGLRYGIHHATVPQFNSFHWPLHQILTLCNNYNYYCCELLNNLKVN